jgi:hypothetical protein
MMNLVPSPTALEIAKASDPLFATVFSNPGAITPEAAGVQRAKIRLLQDVGFDADAISTVILDLAKSLAFGGAVRIVVQKEDYANEIFARDLRGRRLEGDLVIDPGDLQEAENVIRPLVAGEFDRLGYVQRPTTPNLFSERNKRMA